MDQREHNNGVSNFDTIETEGGDVAAMLSALPRVEAPKNFDFRIKARIAEGSAPSGSLVPFLKLAGPLSMLLLVVGFVIFYGALPTDDGRVVGEAPVTRDLQVADAEPSTQTERTDPAAAPPSVPREEIGQSAIQPERVSAEKTLRRAVRRTSSSATVDRERGGSLVASLESANVISARGFESVNPGRRNLNSNSNGVSISTQNVLGIIGVSADLVGGAWKVRAVTANSLAERAGVKAGDIIESIDGNPSNIVSAGEISPKVLRVRREGKIVDLNLQK